MALRTFKAYLDDTRHIRIQMEKRFDCDQLAFTIEKDHHEIPLKILDKYPHNEDVYYILSSPQDLDLESSYLLYDQDRNTSELFYGAIVRSDLFDDTFTYDGDDLGAIYTPKGTRFKLWAPISKQVFLVLEGKPHAMTKTSHGVWEVYIKGNLDQSHYHYLHRVNGLWQEVHDPYALSSEPNSGDSFVINPSKLLQPTRAKTVVPFSQAIIYEMSVRDFSSQPEAGFQHAGQFLGLTESPILDGQAIGLDYVKKLGVTHVQLMPLYDFGSVDELHPKTIYNWGYDPVQYNVPEGSYASNPAHAYSRILELQEAIQTYHDADIRVVMDVVYNHVYNADSYAFERIVPGYFFRYDEYGQRTSGTFCGNDVASERTMVRRYIKHSLLQWLTLYGFDGFRFDLMGILDRQTMQDISVTLKKEYPNVVLYGEGWKMATGLPYEDLAHQYNAHQLPFLSFFNDSYRDTVKKICLNPNDISRHQLRETVQNLLAGSRNSHFISPQQTLNYIECHDNATMLDYLAIEKPDWSLSQQKRAASFALQLTLLSQGTVFLHSGQECFRTKNGAENSYNLPDSINQLDWTRAIRYKEHVNFIRDLIAFRKKHPALSQQNYTDINQSCDFYWLTDEVLRYRIQTRDETIQMVINFSHQEFLYEKETDHTISFTYPPVAPDTPLVPIAGQSICILVGN